MSLPNIRIFDNNGETLDRYTVVLMDEYRACAGYNEHDCLSLCETGRSVSQYSTCTSNWFGTDTEITFESLPDPLQRHIESRLA